MLKKMRMFFALFSTLPLILSKVIDPEFGESIIFPNIPNIKKEQNQKVKDFISKTEEEKDNILKELDKSISDLNEEIKIYISEKKEYPNIKIVELIKKIIEINYYITVKICNKEDNNYQSCINEKKIIMNNLLTPVQDNFGQCSVTIEHINKLTKDIYTNLELLTILIVAITNNIDFIEKNKTGIISNLLECLIGNKNYYWPAIAAQIKKASRQNLVQSLKKRFLELLSRAFSKLSKIRYFNEGEKGSESNNLSNDTIREEVLKEIIDILKEIKESKKDNALITIVSCLITIIILIGGFFFYRFIRRRKNSSIIENTKDFVTS